MTANASWRHALAETRAQVEALGREMRRHGARGRSMATPNAFQRAFDARSTRAPDFALDVKVSVIYCLAFFALNWFVRACVVEPVARRLMGFNATASASTARARRARVQKFAQSALEMVFYGAFTVVGAALVPQQPWFWPSEEWWRGTPTKTLATSAALRCYYLAYGARYVAAMANVLMEHKRKDFWEMQLHHVATILVIVSSYSTGWTRVGAVIMLVLDPADVPLHAAKCAKYVGDARGNKRYQVAADVLFGIFMLTFFVMRLVMYPYVVWSAGFEARRFFTPNAAYYFCVALLCVLLFLQVYWFGLIVKVAHRVVVAGAAEDVRSDDDESDDDDDADADAKKKTK